LALGGRQSIKTPNNQPRVGGSGRGDVIAPGRPRSIVWGGEWNDKKINNIKCIVAFGGCWSIILHTTINQKWAGAVEERMEKRDEHGGVAEGCQCATSACGR
jgi:hypothetical protein